MNDEDKIGELLLELGHRIGDVHSAAMVAESLLSDGAYDLPEGTDWLTGRLVKDSHRAQKAYEDFREVLKGVLAGRTN